jgi:hypothetical protein
MKIENLQYRNKDLYVRLAGSGRIIWPESQPVALAKTIEPTWERITVECGADFVNIDKLVLNTLLVGRKEEIAVSLSDPAPVSRGVAGGRTTLFSCEDVPHTVFVPRAGVGRPDPLRPLTIRLLHPQLPTNPFCCCCLATEGLE